MTYRFSLVIPTRRRETLPDTLRTCLAQEFEDFEVIVSDNGCSPPIHDIVAEAGDRRIKYVRTPRLLAMCDSWEFALEQAAGEFVTVVGCDDGLLLHALPEIDRLLRLLKAEVLRWESVCYNWPSLPPQDHAPPHALLIPLKQANDFYPIHRRAAAPMMQAAANFRLSYTELPMVQSAAIHRRVIDRLRARVGRVFQSRCPDVYSSFAIAAMAGGYYSVAAPMTINGLSGSSTGVACIYLKGTSPIADEFRTLNDQSQIAPHPQAPNLDVLPALVADSFLHARDRLFPNDRSIILDRRQLAVNCIQEARLTDELEWQHFRAALRQSFADAGDRLWFDREYGHRPLAALTPVRHRLKRYGDRYMYLDASEFAATDVFQAAQLCEKLLGGKRDGLNCHLVHEGGDIRC